ncbi:hypothetical protein [Streptomyces sp. CBMA123]|uniref:hypothetical protein n=1 Tax=Streptomyces sp. CBMA123 TaxID=1896313 RepID=UPI001661C4D5|nr:hypothetical protein [Streptomyces sp. CBMA123]MBD0696160.1 hypothetical protein [Streptomyces sp. CBMA123]
MVNHRSSTRIAARLASVAVAVGLAVLPQVGASAQAARQGGTQQAAGSVTGPGGEQRSDEWNATGAWCVTCVKPKH